MYSPNTRNPKLSNHQILVDMDIKVNKLTNNLSMLMDKIINLENELVDLNNRIPIRKKGWIGDYWEIVEKDKN